MLGFTNRGGMQTSISVPVKVFFSKLGCELHWGVLQLGQDHGPYVVLKFLILWSYFLQKILHCTAGKFTGETKKSVSSEEVTEVSMKSTKNV